MQSFRSKNKLKTIYSQYVHEQILVADHSSHAPLNKIIQLHIQRWISKKHPEIKKCLHTFSLKILIIIIIIIKFDFKTWCITKGIISCIYSALTITPIIIAPPITHITKVTRPYKAARSSNTLEKATTALSLIST